MTIYSGFSHWKWWFSIAMLVYQRVTPKKIGSLCEFGSAPTRPWLVTVSRIAPQLCHLFCVICSRIARAMLYHGSRLTARHSECDCQEPHPSHILPGKYGFGTWNSPENQINSLTVHQLFMFFWVVKLVKGRKKTNFQAHHGDVAESPTMVMCRWALVKHGFYVVDPTINHPILGDGFYHFCLPKS